MRRLISLVSLLVALTGLGLILFNATTVDRRPPTVRTVVLSAPAGDPRVAQTLTAIDIEFSEPVRHATVEARFRIDPAVDGAFSWDGSTVIFTPSQKLPADTAFAVLIAPGFEDLAGNVDQLGLEGWTFRTVGPPTVLRATPADGAAGVALDGTVELVFDRLMDTASVEAAIRTEPAAAIVATWRGSVVTLDFGGFLRPGSTYTLVVGADAADTGGSRLGTEFVTHFGTVGTGLSVAATIPADGVAGIGIATPIAVRFSGPIDPDSARTALHVTPAVDGEVLVVALAGDDASGVADGPAAVDTLLFEPSSPLAPHTTYTVTLDPVVTGLGKPDEVAAGRTWTFTTGAPTTSGQNRIAFLSARGGVRNVWVMNPDGTNQRQLTVELLPVSSFTATADGAFLAYAAGGVITTMRIDGSDIRRLTVADGRREYAPVFTPDDARLIVARRDASGADLGYWLVPLPGTSGPELPLLDHGAPPTGSSSLAGDGIAAADGTPAWMPRVAFDPTGDLALLVMSDGETVILHIGETLLAGASIPAKRVGLIGDAAPIWAPDRGAFAIAARSGASLPSALFAVDATGHATLLTGTDGSMGPTAVGPGGWIAVAVRGPDGRAFLRLVGTNGSVRDLGGAAGVVDRWPDFSPDGAGLLFGRSSSAEPSMSGGIWTLTIADGGSTQLARDGAYARWIP